MAIKNHGLSDDLTSQLYEAVEKFFRLQEATKQRYEFPELFGQRGYIGKGKEKAKEIQTKPVRGLVREGKGERIDRQRVREKGQGKD